MSKPSVIILRTAGTNCDEETAHAWELAGATPHRVHVRELMDRPVLLRDFHILTIPGGFSYGDDISAGKILANQLIHRLRDALREFVDAGKLVLGVCNGFQVLIKTGLLPRSGKGEADKPMATLTNNDSARFEARWVHLKSGRKANAFLPPNRILTLPIAHGEGKVVARDEQTLNDLVKKGHVALTYCDAEGNPGPYPINPNGSQADIAGLVDDTGRILGLMPHPERFVDPTQHPEWTRRKDVTPDGRIFFETAVKSARE